MVLVAMLMSVGMVGKHVMTSEGNKCVGCCNDAYTQTSK